MLSQMRSLALLAVVAVAACRTAGTSYRTGPEFPPIDVDLVRVLEAPPAGAIEIGEVEGYGTEGFISGDDALTDAREVAAEIGANCIVVISTGRKLYSADDILARRVSVVRAKAYRSDPLPEP